MATLRTWKEAFFSDKVYCPHQRCTNKTAFFNEAGLEQHLFILQDSAGPSPMTQRGPTEEADVVTRKRTGISCQIEILFWESSILVPRALGASSFAEKPWEPTKTKEKEIIKDSIYISFIACFKPFGFA
jgi:hypothetical protein